MLVNMQRILYKNGGNGSKMVWDFIGQIKTLMKRLSPKHQKAVRG